MNINQALNSSRSFYMAFRRCMEQRPTAPDKFELPLVPGVVCAAFSIELGFKTMLLKEQKAIKGHNLEKIFARLGSSKQSALIAKTELTETQFKKELERIANAFEQWRYVYEHKSVYLNLEFLDRLASAVQNILVGPILEASSDDDLRKER
jgi:hypothetical protein